MFQPDLVALLTIFSGIFIGLGRYIYGLTNKYLNPTDDHHKKKKRIFHTYAYSEKVEPILRQFFKEYFIFFAESSNKMKNLSSFVKSLEKDVKSLEICEDGELAQKREDIRLKIMNLDEIYDSLSISFSENQMKDLHSGMVYLFKFNNALNHTRILSYICYGSDAILVIFFIIFCILPFENLFMTYLSIIVILILIIVFYFSILLFVFYMPINRVIKEHYNQIMVKTDGEDEDS